MAVRDGMHKARAERLLGHRLPRGTRVSLESGALVVFQNAQEQRQLWRRRLVRHAGGDPWTERFCRVCRRIQAIEDFKEYTPGKRTTVCRVCLKARAKAKVKPGHTCAGTLRKTPAELSLIRREAQRTRWRAPGATRRSYVAVDPRSQVAYQASDAAPCPMCGEPGIHADVEACLQTLRMLVQNAKERMARAEGPVSNWPLRRHPVEKPA